ncbi:MAG: hypothetical protein Q7S10_00860 [bacterium]|nr:hypothetical protein [bacterium]
MLCGIIAPRQHEIVGDRDDGYLAECILAPFHTGPHAIKTPEGNFFAWKDDWNCGCCEPEEPDRCIIYWEIQEREISTLSQEQI